MYAIRSYYAQFSVKRYDDAEWQVPKVIMVWGQNPPPTCPDGFYGHWIVDCMKRGSQIISIDPRNTWTSTRAKYHLQIRPGTDGALVITSYSIHYTKLYDVALSGEIAYVQAMPSCVTVNVCPAIVITSYSIH